MTKGTIINSYTANNKVHLNTNPKISFWKKVYRRHTNFSQESIEIEQNEKCDISECNETVFNFDIHRYADIVNNIVVKIMA